MTQCHLAATKPGRFPTFGGSGVVPTCNASEFNMGWINLPVAAGLVG
jgi:hypothetical protein